MAESLGKDVLWDSRGLIIITNAKTAFHYYDEASGVLDKGWGDESNAKIDEILTLFNYLGLNFNLTIKSIIYYMILVFSTILGSIIGVNKFKPNEK